VTPSGRAFVLILLCAALVACDRTDRTHSADTDRQLASVQPENLRIVTLSPHLAELVFAVGAGDLLVGVSAYTDYPEAAAALPVVGDAFNLDQEQLTVLEPDLLFSWETGTPLHVIDELRGRGYRVEVISTTTLDDLPKALEQIGALTGREKTAAAVAERFSLGLHELAVAAADVEPIRVFYQVDARPLYTINGDHFVSQLIRVCGGTNIFADLHGLAPLVSVESVLEREPEVILASSDAGPQAFDEWRRWSDLAAIRYENQFLMPANEIGRATPRLLVGARAVCEALEKGRENRGSAAND
jgi:iron complex transport system substrate-binding protein